ncbi:hypothetical protein ACHAW5_010532 [Stephanodiscus triporus]|uniref:Uncharacterized protein n=1 Tax=Stephanodiscus triporus TaxID=2934178 RepID=A0ABD3P0X8_9STRA
MGEGKSRTPGIHLISNKQEKSQALREPSPRQTEYHELHHGQSNKGNFSSQAWQADYQGIHDAPSRRLCMPPALPRTHTIHLLESISPGGTPQGGERDEGP